MKNEDFVTYDQAVKLKELGFDWECNHYYHLYDELATLSTLPKYENFNKFDKNCSAPTLSQVQKWLREVKNIIVLPYCYKRGVSKPLGWNFVLVDNNDIEFVDYDDIESCDTYEQALSVSINIAFKILKEQNH